MSVRGLLISLAMSTGLTTWASSPVVASDLEGAYVGGSFGRAESTFNTNLAGSEIVSGAAGAGDTVTFTGRSLQKMSDAWWFNTGYFFSPYVAIDAAFLHIGKVRYILVGNNVTASGTQPVSSFGEVVSHGPAISLLGRLPLNESFALDIRVGDYYGKAILNNTLNVGSSSNFVTASKARSSLLGGLGASYTIAGHWSFRLDYLRIEKTGDDSTLGKFSVNLATAGVSFTF